MTDRLTTKQREVVSGVASGLTNREIAQAMGISPQTVKNHLMTVFETLNVRNRVELAIAAARETGFSEGRA